MPRFQPLFVTPNIDHAAFGVQDDTATGASRNVIRGGFPESFVGHERRIEDRVTQAILTCGDT
jgi:hypothetical protein